jgi:hypothetical protein
MHRSLLHRCGLVVALACLLAACGGDPKPGVISLYDHAPVPVVPERTTPVTAPWVSDGKGIAGLADGQYWAETVTARGGALVFELSQALFASACEAVASAAQCADGYAHVADPHGPITAEVSPIAIVSVVADDRQNYAVTGAELLRLVGGGAPSAPAPATYRFSPFPFLLDVQHGAVAEVHQVWVTRTS